MFPAAVTHFPRIKEALIALAESAKSNPSAKLAGLTIYPLSSPGPSSSAAAGPSSDQVGPLVGFQHEEKAVIVERRNIYLSLDVYRFIKNHKVGHAAGRFRRSWKASNGLVIAFGPYSWEIREPNHVLAHGHTILFIPKSARHKVSDLSQLANQNLLTADMLTSALKELAEAVRVDKTAKIATTASKELVFY
jgi:hypothetical protein